MLVVETAPPREGDPIHTLRKEHSGAREGTVFVRHKGKTEQATSIDIAMLTARARATGDRVQLAVHLDIDEPVQARSPRALGR